MHSRPHHQLGTQQSWSCLRICGCRLGFGTFLLGTLLVAAVTLQCLNIWSNHSSLKDDHHIHIWAAFGISSQRDGSFDSSMSQTIHSAASRSKNPSIKPLSAFAASKNTSHAATAVAESASQMDPKDPSHRSRPSGADARQHDSSRVNSKQGSHTQAMHADAETYEHATAASLNGGSNTMLDPPHKTSDPSQQTNPSSHASSGSSSGTGQTSMLRGHRANATIESKQQGAGSASSSGNMTSAVTVLGKNVSMGYVRPVSYWTQELANLLEVPEPFYIPFDSAPYKHVVKMPHRPLWWFGGFVSKTGYGEEARNYMLSLLQSGFGIPELLWASQHGEFAHDISEFMEPWEQQQVTFMTSWRENNKMSPYIDKVIMPHAIVVCHSLPFYWTGDNPKPAWPPPKDVACPGTNAHAFTIGRTMTETHDITPPFAAQCNLMDEVWVPSEFHREQFARGGVHAHKLRVVPEGVNTTFFNPDLYDTMPLPRGELIMGSAHPPSMPRSNITVFMSVFKFENRKGWDVLVESFLTEFNSSDPVELYLLTRKFGDHQPDIKWQVFWFFDKHVKQKVPHFKQYSDLPPIYLVSEYIPSKDLPRFYKAASVVVQPTRGEGWGRPQAEAMAMAIPVISTNWSGVTAFLDDTVGYPLPIDGIYPTWDSSASYFENQTWAGPSISRLKKLMRYVMNHKEEREAKGRAARQRMLERFSPNMIARIVAAELQRVHQRLAPIPTAVKVLCQDAERLEDVNCTTQELYRPVAGAEDSFWADTYGYSKRQEFKAVGLTQIVWAVNATQSAPGSNSTLPSTNPHTTAASKKAKPTTAHATAGHATAGSQAISSKTVDNQPAAPHS